jgi:Cd2+/Zn2+-exporting ATPase
MLEKKLKLEIQVLLPDVPDEKDACLVRLEDAVQNHRGILQAHLDEQRNPACLCMHYDPGQISTRDVQRLAIRAGAKISNRYRHERLRLEGLDCTDCGQVVEHSLGRLDGILYARVNYQAQTVQVEYDTQRIHRREIKQRLHHLGYHIPVEGFRGWLQINRGLILSLVSGLFLLAAWTVERFLAIPALVVLGLYLATYVAGGYDLSRHAWHALRRRQFDTDLLMIVAALGAAALGEFSEGGLLLFLFSLGHALEHRAMDRARHAIYELADVSPKTALLVSADGEIEVPVDLVNLGEMVIVRPGVRIPVDGEIVQGKSTIDQSPVTGESIPVMKVPGEPVYAGTVNGEGVLRVRATRLARDSTLARVVRMVEEAQSKKSPTQSATERFTRVFVPVVLVGALLLILIPPLFGVPFRTSFLRAMTLLVAASPCALALGAPSTILTGLARAARQGVLVKGGIHLENLGRIKTLAFDKTGTLTQGHPALGGVHPVDSSPQAADRLLALAAAVESHSAHPLAQAVVDAAEARGLSLLRVQAVHANTGRGVVAEWNGEVVRVGSARWILDEGVEIAPAWQDLAAKEEAEGLTVIYVTVANELQGILTVADQVRPRASSTMSALRELGVENLLMLTGDNPRVAARIAGEVSIDRFEAELLPEGKAEILRDLDRTQGPVGMVGDGVNDAPAMAHAGIGIAMGGAGTDVALETADVVLMADDLTRLPFAIGLGRAVQRVMWQNLAIALGVIAFLVIASVTGAAGIGLAILLHEGSTVLVVLNALRLLRFQG